MAASRDDFVIAIRSAFLKKGNKQNFSLIAFLKVVVSKSPEVEKVNPNTKNTIKVIVIVGSVVYSIYRICLNSSLPEIADAKFVVSLNGESLSPK